MHPALALMDGWEMTRRSLLHSIRVPYTIVFTILQPIVFALLFRYALGNAFTVRGDYADYLLPGMLATAVAFGSITTSIRLASDLETRAVDRFRSLPMARSALLVGHTTADFLRSVLALAAMTVVGFLIGFDLQTGWAPLLGSLGLMLGLSYALIWLFALVGLLAPNAVTAEAMAFPAIFPLTFASSALVPTDAMPDWLRIFAENQPVTAVVDAARALIAGDPSTEPVLTAVAWVSGLLLVSGLLTIRRYQHLE